MRVPYREFEQGSYYHIVGRSLDGIALFCDDNDYLAYLHRINRFDDPRSFSYIAWCLMPNHFHFLLRQDTN